MKNSVSLAIPIIILLSFLLESSMSFKPGAPTKTERSPQARLILRTFKSMGTRTMDTDADMLLGFEYGRLAAQGCWTEVRGP